MPGRETRRREAARRAVAGRRAEAIAARYLEAAGLQIVGRNVRAGAGEIDIVARDADEVVFVEVRSRRTGSRFAPEGTLRADKRAALAAAAAAWLARNDLVHARCRFDVVAVVASSGTFRVRHLPGAFVVEGTGAAVRRSGPGRRGGASPEP